MSPPSPPPPPPPHTPLPPPPPSNKKWIFWGCGGCLVLAIIIAIILSIGGFGIFQKFSGIIKNSPAYAEALQRVQNSPAVQAELGAPISETGNPLGMVNTNNGQTHAVINFKVEGPKGSGQVVAEGNYSSGSPVRLSKLIITANGKMIDLGSGEASSPPAPEEEPSPPKE